MGTFVSGIELSRRHYAEEVRPLLHSRFGAIPHSAALLGRGSEVLGFDDQMSTDHDWGPRVLLFLDEEDFAARGAALRAELDQARSSRGYFLRELAWDVEVEPGVTDWLTMPEHTLLTLTSGAVFRDEVGLGRVRQRLAYYPRDVWLYLMVAGWWRIHPEMNLVGRTGYVGDELGSSLIGSRLVADVMRLCFLIERRYAPYSKWFGTAFARLACGPRMTPMLQRVMRASTWREREEALTTVYEHLAEMHDGLGLTPAVTGEVVRLWDRPFPVEWSSVPDLLFPLIVDPDVRAVAERWPVGPVDRFRELLWSPRNRTALLSVFTRPE